MAKHQIQFHMGVSQTDFLSRHGSEDPCAQAHVSNRWPDGFRCPSCGAAEHDVVSHGARKLFQC